jgi:hypothetical protein
LSSIERIADAMELAVMLVPEHMAPDIRRYIASQGRVFTKPWLKSCWPGAPQTSILHAQFISHE